MSTTNTEWTGVTQQLLSDSAIRAIPSASARVIVTIDGMPYAGFKDRAAAEEAVRLWSGLDDGTGFFLEHRARGWPAVRGRHLVIVER